MAAVAIRTARLDLVPASVAALQAALESPAALAAALEVVVPTGWPPEYVDAGALQFTLDRLVLHPEESGWWMYFVLLRDSAQRILVGTGGYKGPPQGDRDASVEIGYSVVREHQRRGYATEVVRGLLSHAFAVVAIDRVVAETLPELEPSIGVLRKCGFRLVGSGSEPEVIRFERTR